MVSILGTKALASTFDILNIVRENISKLLISHPGLLECGSSANFNMCVYIYVYIHIDVF
jgi:hypothetical protein